MKVSLIALLLSLSSLAFAEVIPARINNIAKSIRHSYWVQRYQDVESYQSSISERDFAAYLERQAQEFGVEDKLTRAQIKSIHACLGDTNCDVYLIAVSGSYMSGSGEVYHWILLNPSTGKYKEIKNVVYAE